VKPPAPLRARDHLPRVGSSAQPGARTELRLVLLLGLAVAILAIQTLLAVAVADIRERLGDQQEVEIMPQDSRETRPPGFAAEAVLPAPHRGRVF